MGLGDRLFKLEKLRIVGYKDVMREESGKVGVFEAMFNPESLSQSYEILYGKNQGIGTAGKAQRYASNLPSDLILSLILDAGVTGEPGIAQPASQKTVAERVDDFLKVTFQLNGDIHQPNYLVLTWGSFRVFCRLGSLNIRYTSFDRSGNPLRADLDIRLVSDESPGDLQKKARTSSPDLSHSRIVKAGDTLPALAKEVYGSSSHYLWVAQANDLDGFRHLTPGHRLIFPPLPTIVATTR